ncbi:TetR/AcrR family transcriptional regulator [Mycolicibacterium arenosum]|uniref:TetR/AcrR family transcriptional regulator n=1 Tax=Mycolicibacterium arenosum TaxID=2952157 RepID=A0ABT1M936_9MYCO|nr:TetR/AcrR family transcriptional regulator [Mycolicibacterium sp. CAU 1645]MCP9275694.1 TetR/AcrR family transcriptional regulator [Mycolicibacterium sp. CAU 1645]
MSAPQSSDGGARSRTRKAILDAAMSVLADNPTASLADIAAAAEVGRSTLHRYFAERTELLRALALHVHELSNAAIERAEPDCGPPIEALRRVVDSQLDLGPIVPFVYADPSNYADKELAAILDSGDEVIVDVLNRVAIEGSAGPPGWPRTVFWALLNAGAGTVKQGTPRVQVVDAIMVSLTKGTIKPE